MSSNTRNEGEIRKKLLEEDRVECMVALPGQLFTNTQIPACIWFLSKNKKKGSHTAPSARHSGEGRNPELRDRSGEVLFIDARNLGYMKDRVLRDFTPEDTKKIADTFHAWKHAVGHDSKTNPVHPELVEGQYEDIPGYCKSATLEEIRQHDYVLTPGRYVGAAEEEDDGEPFAEKMARLTAQLKEQFEQSSKLEAEIKKNLAGLGCEI